MNNLGDRYIYDAVFWTKRNARYPRKL